MSTSRGLVPLALALATALVSCFTIDDPAPFVPADSGATQSPGPTTAYDRCRLIERRFVANVEARVYGDPAEPQAICVTLRTEIPSAGAGAVVLCVAGRFEGKTVPIVKDLRADLNSCGYCTYVVTNCDAAGTSCATSYAPVTGNVRIVRLGRRPGDVVWFDIGDLEVARVEHRDERGLVLEPRDCLFADGLTLESQLAPWTLDRCEGIDAPACDIARTAGSRFP